MQGSWLGGWLHVAQESRLQAPLSSHVGLVQTDEGYLRRRESGLAAGDVKRNQNRQPLSELWSMLSNVIRAMTAKSSCVRDTIATQLCAYTCPSSRAA